MRVKVFPRYRLHIWLNNRSGEPAFGIQCQRKAYDRFYHIIHRDRGLIYDDVSRAQEVMKQLRKLRGADDTSEFDYDSGLTPWNEKETA